MILLGVVGSQAGGSQELSPDPDFDNASAWDFELSGNVSGGSLNFPSQGSATTVNVVGIADDTSYTITYEVLSTNSNTFTIILAGETKASVEGTAPSSVGVHTLTLHVTQAISPPANLRGKFRINTNNNFVGSLGRFSVKEL